MDRPAPFKRSAYKNELKDKRKPGGHTGTFQAISAYKIELKEKGEEESPASGSARLRRPTDRIELQARE